MNLALFSCVNLSHLEWDTNLPAVNFSNLFAILAMMTVIAVPVVLIVNALRNLNNLQSESYQSRHGALFEGIELDLTKRE